MIWVQNPALCITNCVTLGKSVKTYLNLCFLRLQMSICKSTFPMDTRNYKKCDQIVIKLDFFLCFTFFFFLKERKVYIYMNVFSSKCLWKAYSYGVVILRTLLTPKLGIDRVLAYETLDFVWHDFIVTSFCTHLFLSPLISHSIYFLALSLNAFWLFAKIKSILKVQRFDFSEEILKSIPPRLKSILCILWAITMYRIYLSPWAAL